MEKELAKKQHYVPRLLLRNFSTDADHNMVNIFLVKNSRLILNGGLYNQAYGQYLYGSDQALEEAFGRIESGFSSALRKLVNNDINLTKEEDAFLKIFVLFQRNRTPTAVRDYNSSINAMIKNIASHEPRFKNRLDLFNVSLTNPYHFLFKTSADMSKYVSDLKFGVLDNDTAVPFVLGEHPVVILNPYLSEKKWTGSKQGIGVKGTLITMPISPRKVLLLFDSVRYALTSFSRVVQATIEDVEKLNYCQFLQTYDCIYLNKNLDASYLETFALRTGEYRNSDKSDLRVYPQKKPKKSRQRSELVRMGSKELPIEQNFHFLGYRNGVLTESLGPTMDIRREVLKMYDELHPDT